MIKRYQNTHEIDLVFCRFNKVPSITFQHCDIDLVRLQPSAGSFIWIQNFNQTVIANVVSAWKRRCTVMQFFCLLINMKAIKMNEGERTKKIKAIKSSEEYLIILCLIYLINNAQWLRVLQGTSTPENGFLNLLKLLYENQIRLKIRNMKHLPISVLSTSILDSFSALNQIFSVFLLKYGLK